MTQQTQAKAVNIEEKNIKLPGGDVHYAEAGQGDPVVMIHGYAPISSWHVWDANIPAIAGVRRVLALDLPGLRILSKPGQWPSGGLRRVVCHLHADRRRLR